MIQQGASEKRKRRERILHKIFLGLDLGIVTISSVCSFIFIGDSCSMSFFLFLSIYYLGQSIQHYFILKMPQIDIIKYQKIIKRFLAIVSVIEVLYFFLAFMFWTKFQINPLYCFLCQKLGLSIAIGAVMMVHFMISLLFFIHFLHGFIKRKYYLLALGGFQVQQRLIRQRQQNMQRLGLIQPYYDDYPHQNSVSSKKYYQFEDINQDYQSQKVCSICLTKNRVGFHPILTPCKHFFHRQCIEDWTKINSKCPQCRTQFTQIFHNENIEINVNLQKIEQVAQQSNQNQEQQAQK